MARSRVRRRHKRNPTGTLLVNGRRRRNGGAKRTKRSKRAVSLAGLFSRAAKANPRRHRRHGKRRSTRRNPIMINRRHGKRRSTRRNPIMVNRRRRSYKRRGHKRNPIMVNRRHGRRHKRNPIMVNGRRRSSRRRRNPSGAFGGVIGKAQGMARKVPFLGGLLSAALGGAGAALGGALGVLPTAIAMPYVGKYLPKMLRPYGYSIAGLVMSGIIKVLPVNIPYKNQLAIGVASAGGAVDMYRFRHGKSYDLGDMEGFYWGDGDIGDGDYGDGDMGDYGDMSDGSPLAAAEWMGASLADAEFAGEDFSAEELAAAELGRAVYFRRFPARRKAAADRDGDGTPGASPHAGLPGERWAWLIYWVGFENFQQIMKLPEAQRRHVILKAKQEAHAAMRKLITQGMDPSMTSAETAGLLVTAAA